jgi:hypothetical protein
MFTAGPPQGTTPNLVNPQDKIPPEFSSQVTDSACVALVKQNKTECSDCPDCSDFSVLYRARALVPASRRPRSSRCLLSILIFAGSFAAEVQLLVRQTGSRNHSIHIL